MTTLQIAKFLYADSKLKTSRPTYCIFKDSLGVRYYGSIIGIEHGWVFNLDSQNPYTWVYHIQIETPGQICFSVDIKSFVEVKYLKKREGNKFLKSKPILPKNKKLAWVSDRGYFPERYVK